MKKIPVLWISLIVTMVMTSGSYTLAAGNKIGPPFKSGELIVAGAPGSNLGGLEIVRYLPKANITVVRVERGREYAAVQRFKARGRKASLNYIVHAASVPNDPDYPDQWNFTAVRSEEAWSLSSGSGVTVAVLDTGIATGGNDGIGCIVAPKDVVYGTNYPDDYNGHGTHVSGTIAQTTGNGIGVAGLAYSACIMPVKVLGDSGFGTFSDIAEGIYYAVDNGARIINMSLATDAKDGVRNNVFVDGALDYAYSHGVTVVCAAGNDGFPQNVSYPAIYPTAIAVGATDYNNNVTQYSNKGEGLDIVAPGGDLTKDLNGDGNPDGILQETFNIGGWDYFWFQGTSMASPHVAAVAAMFIAVDSTLTPDLVYQILTTTALDLNQPGYDTTSGYGLVQAYSDADYDGLADSWELSYGLDPENPLDPYYDNDGDGLTNLIEYNLGLDPENPLDANYDNDGDGLTNLYEYNLGLDPQNPDSDNDGIWDGFDGYPLDDQQYLCADLIRNDSTLETFASVQSAIGDPNAIDYDTIEITAASFGEDVVYDKSYVLTLSGGYYCNFSDNPSSSSINSLIIRNGTIIIENLIIK